MNKGSSTQQNIPIAGIKDGIILLKDGGYRVILSVAALNYALKSEQEQNSLIFQYQSFLNSIHFPIQIVMQSKKLDLAPYLKKIKEVSEKQPSDLLKAQAADYIDFVGQLINMANIMKKSFYVIVPYQPLSLQNKGLLDRILPRQKSAGSIKVSETEYNRYKDELLERAGVVASGLGSMGLHCIQLDTEQIIELFYKIYNPDIYAKERLGNIEEIANPLVASKNEEKSSEEEANQPKEELIDNSSIVKERQKQEFQIKQREEEKNAEKTGSVPTNQKSVMTQAQKPAEVSQQTQTESSSSQQGQTQEQNDQNFGG